MVKLNRRAWNAYAVAPGDNSTLSELQVRQSVYATWWSRRLDADCTEMNLRRVGDEEGMTLFELAEIFAEVNGVLAVPSEPTRPDVAPCERCAKLEDVLRELQTVLHTQRGRGKWFVKATELIAEALKGGAS